MIRDEFGDGRRLGLAIDYSFDERPLGTAAPLLLVPRWTTPALVMNGDLLTTIDFAGLYSAHEESGALLTVATQRRSFQSGAGFLRMADDRVTALWEKPVVEWNISAGIYVMDPAAGKYIPPGLPFDMPGLINELIEHAELVRGHPFHDAWHDIGTPDDFERARAEFCRNPARYLAPLAPGGALANHAHTGTADGRPRLEVAALREPVLAASR